MTAADNVKCKKILIQLKEEISKLKKLNQAIREKEKNTLRVSKLTSVNNVVHY